MRELATGEGQTRRDSARALARPGCTARRKWPSADLAGSACAGRAPAAVCAWSALRRSRVARRPLERVVGHLLPARLDTGEV
jgi:hypothetical protein